MNEPEWLPWARKLQAVAQEGLTYSQDPFDRARFNIVRAIAAEITARHTDLSFEALSNLFDRHTGHPAPKVTVRAAVFHGATVLLVRETEGRWSLPGGYADVGESPSEAAARETLEESGYVVRARRLLAVYDRARLSALPRRFFLFYTLFFDCELIQKARDVNLLETTESAFFPLDGLPAGRVPWMAEEIARLFALHQDPALPADFD